MSKPECLPCLAIPYNMQKFSLPWQHRSVCNLRHTFVTLLNSAILWKTAVGVRCRFIFILRANTHTFVSTMMTAVTWRKFEWHCASNPKYRYAILVKNNLKLVAVGVQLEAEIILYNTHIAKDRHKKINTFRLKLRFKCVVEDGTYRTTSILHLFHNVGL